MCNGVAVVVVPLCISLCIKKCKEEVMKFWRCSRDEEETPKKRRRRIEKMNNIANNTHTIRHLSTPLLHLRCIQIDTFDQKVSGKVSTPFERCTQSIRVENHYVLGIKEYL